VFLEIEVDTRTGHEKSRQEVSKDHILDKHPHIMDLTSWLDGARVGSVFSIIARGYKYKRLP
jgi:hypothetical protein